MKEHGLFGLVTGAALLFAAAVAVWAAISSHTQGAISFGTLYLVDSTGDGDLVGPSTSCDDGTGHCTLRAAIEASNLHGGADFISFNIPTTDPGYSNGTWTINLPRALPDVFDSVSIHGPGANALIVNGNQKFHLFKVTTTGTVTLSGITIANGFDTMSNNPEGGGIQNINSGTVNVTNCTLSGNYAYEGGAVYNNYNGGTMSITNCTLSGNNAEQGGAVYSFGTVSITNCTLSNNEADFAGGGIENDGTMTVTNCTLDGNHGYDGGAITNYSTLLVAGSTIKDNSSGYYGGESGGGIENSGGMLTVTNSTISGNQTYGFGGGIFNMGGAVTINCSTITNNSAIDLDSGQGSDGGGIYSSPFSGSRVQIKSSIIALNTATYNRNLSNDENKDGSFVSHGFNLIGTNEGAATYFPAGNPNANNDIVGTSSSPVDPMLNANGLQNNGGPTQTIALLPGSPAIDKGNSTTAAGVHLTVDQRGVGYKRTINRAVLNATGGDGTDIGAFELGAQIKALSRKTHGTAGTFNVNLPLTGLKAGVECRTGGAFGVHQVLLTFPNAVSVSDASVTPDPKAPGATGSVSSFSGSGSKAVTVNLTGVSNAQTILVNLLGVSDGTNTNDVSVAMGVLLGDTNNNRLVGSNDVTLTQSKVGQAVTMSTFREDVTIDGAIDNTDVNLVQSKVGTKLP